jgi:DNA-directed RNA polymerase specialized sigma24 family protein
MAEPLRKRKLNGESYSRPPAVESKLTELANLTRDELAARSEITAKSHPGYVPTECLLHFIRATRHDNSEVGFERLYKELMRRILRRLPTDRRKGSESLTSERIRETVLDRFLHLLSIDRTGYCEKLDYFEVAFDSALSSLRLDGRRRAWREERRTVPMENEETGEILAVVEVAAGSYNPFDAEEIDGQAYRSRLDTAIAGLPQEQRGIIEMLRLGFPIESKDPSVLTIATALKCSEKTVRNRRDRAYATLREKLLGGEA